MRVEQPADINECQGLCLIDRIGFPRCLTQEGGDDVTILELLDQFPSILLRRRIRWSTQRLPPLQRVGISIGRLGANADDFYQVLAIFVEAGVEGFACISNDPFIQAEAHAVDYIAGWIPNDEVIKRDSKMLMKISEMRQNFLQHRRLDELAGRERPAQECQ